MNRRLATHAATLLLAVTAGALGAWGATQIFNGSPVPGPTLHEIVHDELQLSDRQEQQIEQAEVSFARQRVQLEAEVRAANNELAVAIRGGGGDTPEVRAAVAHFHDAMGDLQAATLAHIFEMRSVLTPSQASVFDQRVAEALADEGA